MVPTRIELEHKQRIVQAHGVRDIYWLLFDGQPVLEVTDWLTEDAQPLELHIFGAIGGNVVAKMCSLCHWLHELCAESGGSLLLPLPTPPEA